MTNLSYLEQLTRTYGIKLLYYSDTSDGYRDLTDTLGSANQDDVHKTNNFSGTATPHLHVRFTNFRVTETASSHLRFTLEGVSTE